MTPADGDGLVMSNDVLAELGLDDATRAEFQACWDILCATPPAELAEGHIHAAAALAAQVTGRHEGHPRLTSSGRSLARAAVISVTAFVGTTGLAAADVLPPAAAHVVQTVADTVRTAVDPIPPQLSAPVPEPAPPPAAQAVAPTTTETTDTTDTTVAADPTTTTPAQTPTSLLGVTTTTVAALVDETTSTTSTTSTTVPDDGTAVEASAGSTTTTTVPDDGTATAAGSTTTTTPSDPSTTTTTQPSSSTTTTTPPPTTTP